MDSPYRYRAFGLNILSDLEVPQWPVGEPPWDVHVRWGEVPLDLPNATSLWDGVFWGQRSVCLLSYPKAGRMLIESGRNITLSLKEKGSEHLLSNVLTSTGFTALLYQRGHLCLHASAVARDGRAYLIMGPSGAGKSTLASALLKRGCDFVSDDITVVTPRADGSFEATPSFPAARLNPDAHEAVAFETIVSRVLDPIDGKLRLRFGRGLAPQPVSIARICFLENDDAISVPHAEPMLGQERVGALQRNFFRRPMSRVVGDPQRLATLSVALARHVEVRRITRPKTGFALDELCALVLG